MKRLGSTIIAAALAVAAAPGLARAQYRGAPVYRGGMGAPVYRAPAPVYRGGVTVAPRVYGGGYGAYRPYYGGGYYARPYGAVGFAPSRFHVWVPGYWGLNAGARVWFPGSWLLPPYAGWVWIAPGWVWSGNDWLWQEGHWGPGY